MTQIATSTGLVLPRGSSTDEGATHVADLISDTPLVASEDVPAAIPRDQLYYWTHKWQVGQNESIREIEEGSSRVFTSFSDVARWLLDPSDD